MISNRVYSCKSALYQLRGFDNVCWEEILSNSHLADLRKTAFGILGFLFCQKCQNETQTQNTMVLRGKINDVLLHAH